MLLASGSGQRGVLLIKRLDFVVPLQLIELFAQLGADGLLVEYEDTFPYSGELSLLQASAHPAYR